jgi:hypothetical protein
VSIDDIPADARDEVTRNALEVGQLVRLVAEDRGADLTARIDEMGADTAKRLLLTAVLVLGAK